MQKKKVVIVGSGGHAKVVIDTFKSENKYEIVGFTAGTEVQTDLCGIPCLGDDSKLTDLLNKGVTGFCVALGDNRLRKKVYLDMINKGFTPVNAISQFSYISPYAELGVGIVVVAGAVVNPYAVVENNVIVNTRAGIDHDCRIGSHAHIAPGASLAGSVSIGEGSFIGAGSNVIPGMNVGEWAIVGAGSTVISDIPANAKVVGVPAKKYIIKE